MVSYRVKLQGNIVLGEIGLVQLQSLARVTLCKLSEVMEFDQCRVAHLDSGIHM